MTIAGKVDRELENFVQAVRSVALGATEFSHGPSRLEFAWTSACNLRCVMCNQSDAPPIVKSSKETAAPFLKSAFESVVIWNPSATSEPLLNDVDEMVRLCEEHGVWLELYTNATLLTPERFEKIAPRIHRLTMSIDSHVPEVLERVRHPAKAERIFPHVEYALRRSNELSIPCILNAVMMSDTVVHFPEFVDWAADRGAKELTILDLLDCSTQAVQHDAVKVLGTARVAELLDRMKARATERHVNLTLLLAAPFTGRHVNVPVQTRVHEALVVERFEEAHATQSPGFCPMVGNYLKVNPDGEAFPCCRAPQELRLGNVFEQGLDAVWNGEAAQRLRGAMHRNDPPAPCKGCLVREQPMLAAAIQHADRQ